MPISGLFSLLKKFCCVYIKERFGNVVLVFFRNTCGWKSVVEIHVVLFKQRKLLFKYSYQTPLYILNKTRIDCGRRDFFFGGGGGRCLSFSQIMSISQQKGKLFFFSLMTGHIHSSVQFWIYTLETRRDSGHLDHPPSPLITDCPIHTKKSSSFSYFCSLKTDWSFITQRVCLGSIYLAKTKNFLLKVQ